MKRNEREIRTYCREVRAAPLETDGKFKFEGYAALYDTLSENLGGFREIIRRGAFRTLDIDDIRCLMNHDPNYVLGRRKSGTLDITEDEQGLHFEVTAPDTAWARDLYKSVQRGDIDQCSFAFKVNPYGERWINDELGDIRELLDVKLYDVSIVTYPAYADTTASIRSIQEVYEGKPAPKAEEHNDTDVLKKGLKLTEGFRHE